MIARPAALLALLLAAPSAARGDALDLPVPAGRDLVAERLAAAVASLDQDRRGPRGLAAIARLAELEDDLPELARAAGAYGRVAEDPAADPEVRAAARYRLAAVERARGNPRRSEAQVRQLGFVGAWRVAGPFDDEGKRGLEAVYPPEQGLDLSGRWPGKVREVGWRLLPDEAFVRGLVHLGATLRPAREVVAYALAGVEAPRQARVQLWLGASGATKVWVNDVLVLSDATYHPVRLDQRGVQVTLRKGPNRVLVKLCQQDGRMGFHLRLTDADGGGLALAPADPAAVGEGAAPAPKPLEDDLARLEKRARAAAGRGPAAARAEAEARLDLALALWLRAAGDREERRAQVEAARAAALAPAWVEAQLEAARLEEEHGPRRERIDAALTALPEDPAALRALAQEELDQDRPQEAARLLVRAVRAAPGWPEARVALAEALERAGLAVRSARLAAATAAAFPTVPAAVRAAARAARRLGRSDEAAARLRTLLALRLDDGEARAGLVQLLVERGDVAGATALLAEGIRLDPSDVPLRLRAADLLAANGRAEEAEARFEAALRIAPEDGDALERRGRARLALGKAREAAADLRRALALRPQSPELKELVRSLEAADDRFERPYLLDARALAAQAPVAGPDDDALVLGELKVTRVFPSGLSATFNQEVVKVLDARGADAFRRHTLSWSPDRQEVHLERARILKPDGTVVESHEESERSASEPWYRLYYDTVVRSLSFPALAPGDVLELAWRVEDVAGENLLSDYFGDLTFVDETARKARFEYVLLVPAARAIFSNAPEGVTHQQRALPDGTVEHRWSARDAPRIDLEPGMPGWSEVARFVHVSTSSSWAQVNRFYWGLVKDQLRPTAEVRAEAERLARAALGSGVGPRIAQAEGGPPLPLAAGLDREARRTVVQALYDFVVTQTRYVGLEFGIHGYKPYRVDQVLARRFGDCKDKASLLHALLEAVGIDSRLVLLRTRRLGRLPEAPASLAIFNHAILYVPELDLWLDGTAAFTGSRELPAEDRGATALVVSPDGPPRFGTVPEAPPEENRVESRFEVALAADGTAAVEGAWRVSGAEAPAYRRAYLVDGERRSQLEQTLNRSFPGVKVEEVSVSDLSRLEEDVTMRFRLAVPRFAQPDGAGLRFTPFGGSRGYTDAWTPLSSRRHDLELGNPVEVRFSYRTVLPAGWRVVELPEPASADGPLGGFEIRYRAEEGAVVTEGRVTVKVSRIPVKDYPGFRDLAARIDRAFARKARVAPAAPAAQVSG